MEILDILNSNFSVMSKLATLSAEEVNEEFEFTTIQELVVKLPRLNMGVEMVGILKGLNLEGYKIWESVSLYGDNQIRESTRFHLEL